MEKVGIAVALVDYQYIHATGTGGFTVKIEKEKEYDLIKREGKVSVRVAERNGRDVFAPSFHRDRYNFILNGNK